MAATKTEEQIHAKMANVLAGLDAITKSRSAPGLRFNYRGIDDVLAALHPLLEAERLYLTPEVKDLERTTYQTSNGTIMQLVTVTVLYRFRAEDGSEVAMVGVGEGSDVGDKAVLKAMSGAMKAVMLQAFCIPTEEPGKDVEEAEPAPQAVLGASVQNRADAARTASAGEPEGLDYEVKFGKFKGETWRQMLAAGVANPDGDHASWLSWLAGQPIKADKYQAANEKRLVLLKWILREIEARQGERRTESQPELEGPPPPEEEFPQADADLPF